MVITTNSAAQPGTQLRSQFPSLLAKGLRRVASRLKNISAQDQTTHATASILFQDRVSRTTAAYDELNKAIAFSLSQDEALRKVSFALTEMSERCSLSQGATQTASEQTANESEFLSHCDCISSIAHTELEETRLFSNSSQVIAIDEDSGTFLTSDISLDIPAYTNATSSSISKPKKATAALNRIKVAINQLATDRARVRSNISILMSAREDLQVRQENLCATNPQNSHDQPGGNPTTPANYRILVEAGNAMLAQLSTLPDSILKLPSK